MAQISSTVQLRHFSLHKCQCMLQDKSSKVIQQDVHRKNPKMAARDRKGRRVQTKSSATLVVLGTASTSSAVTSTTEKGLSQPAKQGLPVKADDQAPISGTPTAASIPQVCLMSALG